jgi:hypothetical protein
MSKKNQLLQKIIKSKEVDAEVLSLIVNKTDDPYVLVDVVHSYSVTGDILFSIINKTDIPHVLNIIANKIANYKYYYNNAENFFIAIINKTNNVKLLDTIGTLSQDPEVVKLITDKFKIILDQTDDYQMLKYLATSSITTYDMLLSIIDKTDSASVLLEVSKNKLVDSEIFKITSNKLKTIVNDNLNDEHVLFYAALNPLAASETLAKIANKTTSFQIIETLARNPSSDEKVLEIILSKMGDNFLVLNYVAQSPSVNDKILKIIRSKLLQNVNATEDRIILFSISKNPAVNDEILTAIQNKINSLE